MTPLSYEVTWLLTPEQCLYSGSKILSGLCDLERAGFLSLRLSTRIPFTEPIGSPICLEVCSAADGRRRKIVLDLHDSGAWFFSNSLAFADVYFKRGFVPSEVSKLPADARAKVVPLGLNYSCLSHGARRTLVAIARKNVLRGLLRSPRRRFRKLVEDLKHLKGLPQPEAFEQDPTAPREPTVLFQTRVWPDEGTATDYFSQVNVERVALVRALRAALGDRFRGGVMADAFAREYCPTQLAESDIHRSAYAQLIRKTTVAVYTRGLHDSLAFKLAEYLAAGVCIVSDPFKHRLPVDLVPGVNYLPFTTHEECIRQCRRLLDNPTEAQRMREANVRYYRDWVEPQAHVRDLLARAFREEAAEKLPSVSSLSRA